jgi:hypothetical protein
MSIDNYLFQRRDELASAVARKIIGCEKPTVADEIRAFEQVLKGQATDELGSDSYRGSSTSAPSGAEAYVAERERYNAAIDFVAETYRKKGLGLT